MTIEENTARRAANDNAPPVLGWPTLERLVYRRDRQRVAALRFWRDLTAPPRSTYTWTDDSDIPTENPGDPELYREVRPSVTEALTAVGWRVTGQERWLHTRQLVDTFERTECAEHTSGNETRIGDLLFRNGKLIEYGRTAKDKPKRPADRPRGAKGGRAAPPRDPREYLAKPAAVASPLAAEGYRKAVSAAPAIPPMYDPLPAVPSKTDEADKVVDAGRYGVERARAVLRAAGVDGSISFANLPHPATRYPSFALHGKQWIGGIVRGKGAGAGQAWDGADATRCATPDVGQAQIETEMARTADERRLRKLLGGEADILDMAVTDATAREIGMAAGMTESSARKYGARLTDRALDRLLEADPTIVSQPIADNNNGRETSKKVAA